MNKEPVHPLQQASVLDVRAMTPEELAALGFRVLVMRKWPQGISWSRINLWLPDAGPSRQLLEAYQAGGIDWEEFAQRYRIEQRQDWNHAGYFKVGPGDEGRRQSGMSPLQHLYDLRRQHGLVTVLCHEREGNCHRHVLVQLANEADERTGSLTSF